MSNVEKFTQALEQSIRASNTAAQRVGYGSPLTPTGKQQIIETLSAAVDAFNLLAADVRAAMEKAFTLVGSDVTFGQTVADITREVENYTKAEEKKRREQDEAAWRAR